MIVDTKTKVARERRRIGLMYMVHSSKHAMIVCNDCILTEIVEVMLKWCSNLYTCSDYISISINFFCWNIIAQEKACINDRQEETIAFTLVDDRPEDRESSMSQSGMYFFWVEIFFPPLNQYMLFGFYY